MNKYKQDGVDINTGDAFSSFCGEICKSTYQNSKFVEVHDLSQGNFRGPRGIKLQELPSDCLLTMAADGIGTKVVPIVASGKMETAASNVIAMTAMDITRYGGLPLVFMNIFDVNSLGDLNSETYEMCRQAMLGLQKTAKENTYVVLGGETAELGVCVGSEDPNAKLKFNWGGVMFGVYKKEKMIYGNTLKPGQAIMTLKDNFRSNGFSSLRTAFRLKYGQEWYNNLDALPDIIAASSGSTQYDRFLNYLHGWDSPDLEPIIPMHLIVHLSGGAFESKLGKDMLEPQGLSTHIYDLFNPSQIMLKCAHWRGFSDEECYSTWNGGQGALVVIDVNDVAQFLDLASQFGIDAKLSGKIIKKEKYTVLINSKFSDKIIHY